MSSLPASRWRCEEQSEHSMGLAQPLFPFAFRSSSPCSQWVQLQLGSAQIQRGRERVTAGSGRQANAAWVRQATGHKAAAPGQAPSRPPGPCAFVLAPLPTHPRWPSCLWLLATEVATVSEDYCLHALLCGFPEAPGGWLFYDNQTRWISCLIQQTSSYVLKSGRARVKQYFFFLCFWYNLL